MKNVREFYHKLMYVRYATSKSYATSKLKKNLTTKSKKYSTFKLGFFKYLKIIKL